MPLQYGFSMLPFWEKQKQNMNATETTMAVRIEYNRAWQDNE